MLIKAPKGTKDITPDVAYKWQYIEQTAREICSNYGYNEIRTPVFEHTELFERGVGDTTDVVQKEMYTFFDKGNRSITLRPEGTAGAVRSFLENHMYANPLPVKMFYNITCYRYEKPQSGRLREFHQFGIESFGSIDPSIDAEVISIAYEFLRKLKIKNLSLHISSIGCPECRRKYNEKLIAFLESKKEGLCETCQDRMYKNPLRIFDCKSEVCAKIVEGAPLLFDYICEDCADHFNKLKENLDIMGISYEIDKKIVRGLDYYTKTVFEFISDAIGAQGTVCGGGRYDGLVEELGGDSTPGIGFALGIERLILLLESENVEMNPPEKKSIYIANIGDKASLYAQKLVYDLRKQGICAEKDTMNRSLKAQMKYADKTGFTYTVCLGDDEIKSSRCQLKNMINGEKKEIDLDALADELMKN